MKSKIDKTDAPNGYEPLAGDTCLKCELGCLTEACLRANCLTDERRDGRNVVFRRLKKGGTQ